MNFLKKLFGPKKPQAQITIPANSIDRTSNNKQATSSVATMNELEEMFNMAGLAKYFEKVSHHVKHKLEITTHPTDEDQLIKGQSKIGGQPDLPAHIEWPKTEMGKSMSFIAQINLSDTAIYNSADALPQYGLLSFFNCADQEAWGFDPKDKYRFRVIYTENITELERTSIPYDLDNVFTPNKVTFNEVLSIPGAFDETISKHLENSDVDSYCDIEMPSENQMFGYPCIIQNAMELECQLVTNGLYCGDSSGYNDPRAKLLEEGAKDWLLLLQIGSEDDKTGMMWGDAGNLYYWIRKQDLENKAFDKAWMILQCY